MAASDVLFFPRKFCLKENLYFNKGDDSTILSIESPPNDVKGHELIAQVFHF